MIPGFDQWDLRDHPLFDAAYYLRTNPDVRESGLDPLAHYLTWGALELRNPHPLFDAKFYAARHSEILKLRINPLVHFLLNGRNPGCNPNPFFDVEFYLWRNPDVAAAGVNPLVHYLEHGAAEGRDPHPLFDARNYLERNPDVAAAGLNPLRHYCEYGQHEGRVFFRTLRFSERLDGTVPRETVNPKSIPVNSHSDLSQPVPVFCVYGASNVKFLEQIVIPAFATQSMAFKVELHFLNYHSNKPLIKSRLPNFGSVAAIKDWSDVRPQGHFGFGEGMNYLFFAINPSDCFFYCNPDSFPMSDCLARLMDRYMQARPAIVEARQWPSPHPKEFNKETLETPWASGAFGLVSATAFRELKGFDPVYFLYLEDVDLSWRAWLNGFRVLHEPLALSAHSTGLYSYRINRFYYEHFFSLRNFLVISYKFFGELGERTALAYLERAELPVQFHKKIISSYHLIRPSIVLQPAVGKNTDKVKILGLNVFHEFQH